MKKFDFAFFDVDGTVCDSGEGVKTAFLYALNKFGISDSPENMDKIMGPPLYDSFVNYYGLGNDDAVKAIEYYRSFYREKGIFMNRIYDGIPETLQALVNDGVTVCTATSKPRVFACTVLQHYDLLKYFTTVYGSEFDGTRSAKEDVIAYALQQSGVSDPSTAVMIGDRSYDILGGKKFGMVTVGAMFGYGTYDELKNAGADHIAVDGFQLKKILCGE